MKYGQLLHGLHKDFHIRDYTKQCKFKEIK